MATIIGNLAKALSFLPTVKGLFVAPEKLQAGDFVIQIAETEEVVLRSKITKNPVEDRRYITDHIFKEEEKVIIKGLISESTMRYMGIIDFPLQNNSFSSIIQNAKVLNPFGNQLKESTKAFDILKTMYEAGQPVTVLTSDGVMDNMLLEECRKIKTNVNRGATEIHLTLVKVYFASLKKTSIFLPNIPKSQRFSEAHLEDTQSLGQKEPEGSYLSKGADAVGDAVNWAKDKIKSLF